MSVGIGIIGCGGRIRSLLGLVPGLGEQIEVRALCDPFAGSIEAARALWPAARVYEDYRALAAAPEIDWVFVGSWNCFHRDHAIAALEAGKDVFCEKPLATTPEDCLAMRDAQRRTGRRFVIGFTLRYSPHYRKLKEVLDSGAIGRIVSMEFNEHTHWDHGGYIHGDWRRLEANAGSHLLEKCCHDIDLAHWIVGALPRRVASFGGTDFFVPANRGQVERVGTAPNGRPAYSVWPAPEYHDPFGTDKDIVDNQVAIMEFENNVRATFHTNCNNAIYERRMLLLGTEGTLRADINAGRMELCRIGYDQSPEQVDTGVLGGHGGGDEVLGVDIAEAVLKGHTPPTTLEDGLRAAFTCFGIDEARASLSVVEMSKYWDQL